MTDRFAGRAAAFFTALLCASANVGVADVVHLRTGGRLDGVMTAETASAVTIDVGMGRVTVSRASVLRIEHKASALSEYRARLAAIRPGDVTACADLARFADDNGLRREARTMWARVASLDPAHVEAHLALGHVLVGGAYVDEDEAYRSRGFVFFDGRWMTGREQSSLLRQREQQEASRRDLENARREARAAEDRARRAEDEALRARTEAARSATSPFWGYAAPAIVPSTGWNRYASACYGPSCPSRPHPRFHSAPAPVATPTPRVVPVRPSSIR